jgi:hypothetical protein
VGLEQYKERFKVKRGKGTIWGKIGGIMPNEELAVPQPDISLY